MLKPSTSSVAVDLTESELVTLLWLVSEQQVNGYHPTSKIVQDKLKKALAIARGESQ